MANCIGYETLVLNGVAMGPTAKTVRGGVACAIFFIDPDSESKVVRYRPDQPQPSRVTDVYRPPTSTSGIPLRRGKSIVVAGEGSIRNSLFMAENGKAIVHCLYYDRVDVVDLELGVDQALIDSTEGIRRAAEAILTKLDDYQREKKEADNG